MKNKIPPIYLVTIFYILGITAQFHRAYFLFPLTAFLAFFSARKMVWKAFFFLVFLFGFFYTGRRLIALPDASPAVNIKIEGEVRGLPAGGKFILKTSSGSFAVYVKEDVLKKKTAVLPSPGDKVMIEGKILIPDEKRNFSSTDWRSINAVNGISGRIFASKLKIMSSGGGFWQAVFRVRKILEKKMATSFHPSVLAYLMGFIWGDKSGLTSEIMIAFRRTGLMHLLAVSGLHVGLFASVFVVFISFVTGVRRALLISIPFAFFYSFLCGVSPSSVRAAVMFAFLSAGLYSGRRGSLGSGLFAAALIMLIVNPMWLFAVGFKLSFLAAGGIIFFSPVLTKIFKHFMPNFFAESFSIGISCQLFILPALNETFFEISVITPFINIFVLPLAGGIVFSVFLFFIMSLVSAVALTAPVFLFLSRIFASAASFFVTLLGVILKTTSSCPFAMASIGHFPLYVYLAFYAVLFAIISKKRRFIFSSLGIFAASVFYLAASRMQFKVYVPYFGAGDCVFFTSRGKWFQAGTASDVGGNLPEEYKRFVKYHGIKKIEGCFILSPSIYHLGAFDELLKAGLVKKFYLRVGMPMTNEFEHILYAGGGKNIFRDFKDKVVLGGVTFSLSGEAMKAERNGRTAVYSFGEDTNPGPCDVFIGDVYERCKYWVIPQLEKREVVFTLSGKVKKKTAVSLHCQHITT